MSCVAWVPQEGAGMTSLLLTMRQGGRRAPCLPAANTSSQESVDNMVLFKTWHMQAVCIFLHYLLQTYAMGVSWHVILASCTPARNAMEETHSLTCSSSVHACTSNILMRCWSQSLVCGETVVAQNHVKQAWPSRLMPKGEWSRTYLQNIENQSTTPLHTLPTSVDGHLLTGAGTARQQPTCT